jgi:2-aminoadipate transaminase
MSVAVRLSRLAQGTVEAPISYLMREALAHPELISLAAGFVDQASLPVENTLKAVEDLLSDPARGREALQYSSTMGDSSLREMLLCRLAEADQTTHVKRSVEQVIVTAGSNELLYHLGLSLLDRGDIVLCAAPSYFVYLGALRGIGARAVGLAVDEQGVIPEAFEAALEKICSAGLADRLKAIYLTTYFDNPSSITTSADRRAQIVKIARRFSHNQHKIYIIEDAAYRDLRYYAEDIPSLFSLDEDGDIAIYTSSFSKSYSPGLRVGWGVLPAELAGPLSNQQGNVNFGAPHFSQQVILSVLRLGLFEKHLDQVRENYRAKLEVMLAAAETYLGDLPNVQWLPAKGGLYVWMKLAGIDTGADGPLFSRALARGVLYVPGCHCYPPEGEPIHTDRIRLSFGVQPIERIERGMQLLAEAVREVLSHPSSAVSSGT